MARYPIAIYSTEATATPTNETASPSATSTITIIGTGSMADLFTSSHIWYMRGYPDDTFRPDGSITRAETALALYRLLTPQSQSQSANTMNFTDVKYSDWYGLAIATLTNLNLLHGYPDGSFRPNQPITRAEMAVLITEISGINGAQTTGYFDVNANHWAYTSIQSATANGYMKGFSDGTFKPQVIMTRAEFAVTMNALLNRGIQAADVPGGIYQYTDLPTTYWAYGAIMEACNSHNYTGTAPNEQWTQITGNGLGVAYNQ